MMTVNQPFKRTPERSQEETNGVVAKRARPSPRTPEINGAALSQTPTRTSRRLAAISPPSESEKKKPKR